MNKEQKTNKPVASKKDASQGVDKAPGEEHGKNEKVTNRDLKGKKIDADPSRQSDRPS